MNKQSVFRRAALIAAAAMFFVGVPAAGGTPQILYFGSASDGALIASQPAHDGSVIVETDFGQAGNQGQIVLLTPQGKGHLYSVTTLKVFNGTDTDGGHPSGHLAIDSAGNIWGMTNASTAHTQGTVFELSNSSGTWSFRTAFVVPDDAGLIGNPNGYGGVLLDKKGNLFGIAAAPCQDDACGTVFEIPQAALNNPKAKTGLQVLYRFTDGHAPIGMVRDEQGDLFGVETHGGEATLGSVWEVSPPSDKNGVWSAQTIHSFCMVQDNGCPDGYFPEGVPTVDALGNLYGTTSAGGDAHAAAADGTVWKMTRSGANFTFQTVHTLNDEGCNAYADNKVTTPVARTLLARSGEILSLVLSGGVKHVCTGQQTVYQGALVKTDPSSGSDTVENKGWGAPTTLSGPTGVGSDPTLRGEMLIGTSSGYYDSATGESAPGVVFSITP